MRIIILIFFFFSFIFRTAAQHEEQGYETVKTHQADEAQIPDYPDIFYEYRIAELNKKTPIELEYNEAVKKYIDIYAVQRREEFAKIIGLSQLYFPVFDEMLAKYDLPLELKYLTIVESALNPFAVSKSGAVGLWQFLLNTCRLFDLEVNSYIDERRDVYKSTDAACRYLQYLYGTFNDWQLVLSSYNGGPGDVRKAIERSKGKMDYWQLRPYLSHQAQNYVPAFIAACYLMNFYPEHHIIPVAPEYNFFDLDTLKIDYYITFKQITEKIDIPLETLRYLNPVYKCDIIPDMAGHALLILPKEKVLEFIRNESRILGNEPAAANYLTMLDEANYYDNKVKITYTVQKGDFFHKIAMKYNCSIENIKTWNNLHDNSLVPGQKLIVWVDKSFYQKNFSQ
ncbi:MAG: transglycosylase SLT domain-containing protein [Bacteroidales bacterium]|nr:transglycosylase SLT domain-containing protein [Bacteroidales bacterium]